jgi:hypothetical protein
LRWLSGPGRRLRAWVALAAFLGTLAVPLANARHAFRIDDAACALALLRPLIVRGRA